MATALVKIEPDVMEVLRTSEIEGQALKLPGQLDRKLYVKVNKVLELLGGSWNRKASAHLFEGDPACVVAEAIEDGAIEDPIKKYQYYPTPLAVAQKLVQLAAIEPHHTILEPSAGTGSILAALPKEAVNIEACEINEAMAAELEAKGHAVHKCDFLTFKPSRSYERIVANPPFTRKQDVTHADRMLDLLAPGGRLVTVLSAGATFGSDRKTVAFRERLAAEFPDHRFEKLESGAFRSSGTMVNAVVLVATRPAA